MPLFHRSYNEEAIASPCLNVAVRALNTATGSVLWTQNYPSVAAHKLFFTNGRRQSRLTEHSKARLAEIVKGPYRPKNGSLEDRSFAVSGPVVWNSLPVAQRSSDVTEETFRRQLKTVLIINYVDS